VFYSNVLVCGRGDLLLMCPESQSGELNVLNYNTWFTEKKDPETVLFVWDGTEFEGFEAYRSSTGQDAKSRFTDPGFANPLATNFNRKAR
jgi:hypothetical protein